MVEGAGKGGFGALVHPEVLLEAEAFAVAEQQALAEEKRRAGEDGGVATGCDLVADYVHDLGILDEAFAEGLEDVIHHDGGGLALGDGFAGGVHLVAGDVVSVLGGGGGDLFGGLIVPLHEVGVLVLEGVGELVGKDGLLLLDRDPVKQGDALGFGVVIGLDLLLEQGEEEGFEIEIAVEKTELLEHDFAALHAFGAFVLVEFLLEVGFDISAGGELALDLAGGLETGFGGGEGGELVDKGEELFGLVGGDGFGWLGRGLGGRGVFCGLGCGLGFALRCALGPEAGTQQKHQNDRQ